MYGNNYVRFLPAVQIFVPSKQGRDYQKAMMFTQISLGNAFRPFLSKVIKHSEAYFRYGMELNWVSISQITDAWTAIHFLIFNRSFLPHLRKSWANSAIFQNLFPISWSRKPWILYIYHFFFWHLSNFYTEILILKWKLEWKEMYKDYAFHPLHPYYTANRTNGGR